MDYQTLPATEVMTKVATALQERNVTVHLVQNRSEALAKVQELIPAGGEMMTAGSTTLEQIGLVDLLKSGNHPWTNLKDAIMAEKDPAKQNELRKKSVTAAYFLGSVHALTEDGTMLVASATGSQLPGYAFSSDTVIWVVGAQKIVPDLETAFRRVREYVFPLEDERMKSVGYPGSTFGKWFIFEREIMPNRKVHLILVNEAVGF
jgi:L-lactate utilization protein LutC